jgi:two-component system chemotaxis response regulator CheY
MSGNLKALVVDDSRVMRRMVMDSLQKTKLAEFEFIEAEDGRDALEKVKDNEFQIAFVDWNMPNMTGVEFIREVRRLDKIEDKDPIPLIMVTSEKTMGKVQEALDDAGADGFITKPFTVEELEPKLRKPIEQARMVQMKQLRRKRDLADAQTEEQPSGGFFGKLFG